MEADKKLTGYPSTDKPWLKYYQEGAEERANNIPRDKTVWDVIEEKSKEYIDIPAIEYFGREISRTEFSEMVYTWARVFKALGVKEDEVILYYGPFFPVVGAMAFALNIIGACPYFLKLAISSEALAEEAKDSRIAIVYDDMWPNVSNVFSKDSFDTVIFVKVTDDMPSPKKQAVSLLTKMKSKSGKLPVGEKYITVKQALKLADSYKEELKVPFVQNRSAFITSSSGTTVGGEVKGTVATNESTLAQLKMGDASGVQFFPGERCLNQLPPTASTSLNILFFLPLYRGMTIVIDPRTSEKDFYRQAMSYRTSVIVTTGSLWETFFKLLEKDKLAKKKVDFTTAKCWVVGGEGTDAQKYKQWKQDLIDGGSPVGIASAYGSSELFSCICTELPFARYDFKKPIVSVGIPYAGITVGVFDDAGTELGYNHRGELWIKSQSAMKEYFNKPELTAQTKVDGWIHTGDLGEIDENGFVYIWGRVKDFVEDRQGNKIYLFDVANRIKEKSFIDDAIVLPMKTDAAGSLVAHIVWAGQPSAEEQIRNFEELNDCLKEYLPQSFSVVGYAVHDGMLPYSPTTLKKDKNKLSKQTSGYVQAINGRICNVEFVSMGNGRYKFSVND